MKLDSEGFIVGSSGLAITDEGGLIDIIYQKLMTNKWYIMFFPWSGLGSLYSEIENSFYAPKTDRAKGFELSALYDKATVLVFAYKKWMSNAQLNGIMRKYTDMVIPEDKDVFLPTIESESIESQNTRFLFHNEFADYYRKQMSNE